LRRINKELVVDASTIQSYAFSPGDRTRHTDRRASGKGWGGTDDTIMVFG
jgi:hypothetical protein